MLSRTVEWAEPYDEKSRAPQGCFYFEEHDIIGRARLRFNERVAAAPPPAPVTSTCATSFRGRYLVAVDRHGYIETRHRRSRAVFTPSDATAALKC